MEIIRFFIFNFDTEYNGNDCCNGWKYETGRCCLDEFVWKFIASMLMNYLNRSANDFYGIRLKNLFLALLHCIYCFCSRFGSRSLTKYCLRNNRPSEIHSIYCKKQTTLPSPSTFGWPIRRRKRQVKVYLMSHRLSAHHNTWATTQMKLSNFLHAFILHLICWIDSINIGWHAYYPWEIWQFYTNVLSKLDWRVFRARSLSCSDLLTWKIFQICCVSQCIYLMWKTEAK